MGCFSEDKLQQYLDGEIYGIEGNLIRDHLLKCDECSRKVEQLRQIENSLKKPELLDCPPEVQRSVMLKLFPVLPKISAIVAMSVAALMLFVSAVFIYFDFSNDSIIRAWQITSQGVMRWIMEIIKGFSAIYQFSYFSFKIISGLFRSLQISLSNELALFLFLTLIVALSLAITFLLKRVQRSRIK